MRKETSKKKNKLDDFLFDDCPICQDVKAADKQGRNLSLAELKKSFAVNKKSKNNL